MYQGNTYILEEVFFPDKSYPFVYLLHSAINELALRCIYIRDTITEKIYVQYFCLATALIESYLLKHTQCNLNVKRASKYSLTHTFTAILQYPGCIIHEIQHLTQVYDI